MTTPLPDVDVAAGGTGAATGRARAHNRALGPILFGVTTFLVAVVLIGISHPRRIGDGHEYLAMARSLVAFELPIYTDAAIDAELAYQLGLVGYRHARFGNRAYLEDGRFVLPHFFVYSALAAPFLPVTEILGIHPHYAFAALGALLISGAAAALAARLGWQWALLFVASPIVWWLDKGHTELFTFALLAIALALLPGRPWWSLVAIGLAATQNLPIAAGVPVLPLAALAAEPGRLRDTRLWLGGAAGTVLALLNPVFHLVTIGRLSPIESAEGLRYAMPSPADAAMFVLDPNFGLLNAAPFLVLTVAATAALVVARGLARRARPDPELLAVVALAAVFLVAFNQTLNLNSGGTHDVSRYAMWLVPLAVPLLARVPAMGRRAKTVLAVGVMVSAAYSLASFAPWQSERYKEPTAAALFVWEHLPWLDQPYPEVFRERLTYREGGPWQSVAGPGCAKVLVIDGAWPVECAPVPVLPDGCVADGARCFADRRGAGWDIGPARAR